MNPGDPSLLIQIKLPAVRPVDKFSPGRKGIDIKGKIRAVSISTSARHQRFNFHRLLFFDIIAFKLLTDSGGVSGFISTIQGTDIAAVPVRFKFSPLCSFAKRDSPGGLLCLPARRFAHHKKDPVRISMLF